MSIKICKSSALHLFWENETEMQILRVDVSHSAFFCMIQNDSLGIHSAFRARVHCRILACPAWIYFRGRLDRLHQPFLRLWGCSKDSNYVKLFCGYSVEIINQKTLMNYQYFNIDTLKKNLNVQLVCWKNIVRTQTSHIYIFCVGTEISCTQCSKKKGFHEVWT